LISITSTTACHKIMASEPQIYQAAGHGSIIAGKKGTVLKVVQNAELSFYQRLKEAKDLKVGDALRFFPTFYDVVTKDGKKYIEIEDLTANMEKPCIMDIKMGTISAGEDADEKKRQRMLQKDQGTTTISLGIRFSGMRVYHSSSDEWLKRDKAWGKKLTDTTILDALKQYFSDGQKIRTEVVNKFLNKLAEIKAWFDKQSLLRIYSSSLLFVYDGSGKNPDVTIKMIDFAHVFDIKDHGKDESYLIGLNNLIACLKKLQ